MSQANTAQAPSAPPTPSSPLSWGCEVVVGDMTFLLPPNLNQGSCNREPSRLNLAIRNNSSDWDIHGSYSENWYLLDRLSTGTVNYSWGMWLLGRSVPSAVSVRYFGQLPEVHHSAVQSIPGSARNTLELRYYPDGPLLLLTDTNSRRRRVRQSFPVCILSFLSDAFSMFQNAHLEAVFPANYFSCHTSSIGVNDQVNLFKDLVQLLRGIAETLENSDQLTIISALAAQEYVLKRLTKQLVRNKYCETIDGLLSDYHSDVDLVIRSINADIMPSYEGYRMRFAALIHRFMKHIETIRLWNEEQKFLCGKSVIFDGVTNFSDLFPKEEIESDCCDVCLITPLTPSADFGILSHCKHIFCSPCIRKWFKNRSTCPVCRQESVWMDGSRFQRLRTRIE